MEKLSKELREYLQAISLHENTSHYFLERLEGLSYKDAYIQADNINSLHKKEMIRVSVQTDMLTFEIEPSEVYLGDGVRIKGDGKIAELHFPVIFWLTSDGRNYRKEARKQAVLWIVGAIVTAILSGFFA